MIKRPFNTKSIQRRQMTRRSAAGRKRIIAGLVITVISALALVRPALAGNPFFPYSLIYYQNNGTKTSGDATTVNSFPTAYSYRTTTDGDTSTRIQSNFGITLSPGDNKIFPAAEYPGDPAYATWDTGSSSWTFTPQVGDQYVLVLEARNDLNSWTGPSWVGGAKVTLTTQMAGDSTAWFRDVVMEPIPTPTMAANTPSSVTIQWQGLWDNDTGASGGTGPGSIVGYTIYRSVDGGSYSAYANKTQAAGSNITYTDTGVSDGHTYKYKLGVRFEWQAHTGGYFEPQAQGPESAAMSTGLPEPVMLKFISTAPNMQAGTKSAVQTIQTADAAGNATAVTSDTTVSLTTSSTGANAKFYSVSAGACTSTVITDLTITTGNSTAQFCYYDEKAGSWTLTATKTNPASPAWANGTQTATVTSSNTLGSIELSLANAQKSRIAFTGTNTLTAKDNYGNVMTGFSAATNNVTFSVSPGTANVAGLNGTGNAQLTLAGDTTNGVANLTSKLQLRGQAGSYTVTATTSDGKTSNANVTLGAGGLDHFDFSLTDPQRIDTAFSGTNTLTAKDADNNTITDFNAQTTNVTIAESGGAGTVSGLSGGTNTLNQSGSFVNGVANLSGMKYVGTAAAHSFRATAGSVNSTSGAINFAVGPLAKFSVSLNNNQPNAQAFSTARITAQDAGNNTVSDFDAATNNVALTVNSGSLSGITNLTQANSFTNGIANLDGQLTYTGQAGSRTITATSANGKTGNATVTIVAGTRTSVKVVNGSASGATEVDTASLTADQTLLLYAAGYDVSNNWTGLVNGTWSSNGTLAPAVSTTNANTITFAPTTAPVSGAISFSDGSLNDSTGTITVTPGVASRLVVTAPGTAIAGQPFNVTLTAVDADGNTVTSYNGSQTLTFSGPGNAPKGTTPTYPPNATFTNGTATISVTLVKAETVKLTANRGALTGQSADIVVSGAGANTLAVSAPASATAGQSFSATLTAFDNYGNVDTGYTGDKTVTFANPGAAPNGATPDYPATVTFANGTGTANVTLFKKETTTLKATEGSRTGTSGNILVGAAAGTRIVAVGGGDQTGPVSQALPDPIIVRILDAYDNQKDNFNVNFVVTSGGGSVSAGTVATADDGRAQVTWTMGGTPGENNNKLEARAPGLTGSPIEFVASANGNGFVITIPDGVVAGTPFSPTIRLVDSDGNTVTSYNGTKTVVFSGPSNGPDGTTPTYPVTITFVNGVPQSPPQITLVAAETTTLTIREGNLVGTSAPFTVSVGPAAKLSIITPAQQIALNTASQAITVCVQDQFGNAVIASQNRQLNMAATSPGALFSQSADGPWNSYQATLGAGLNCTNVFYKDSYAGAKTITIASAGLSEATQQISIAPSTAPPDTNNNTSNGGTNTTTVVNRETVRTIFVYADKPAQQTTTPGQDVVAVPLPTSVFPVIKTPRRGSFIAPLDGNTVISGTAQPNRAIRVRTESGVTLGSATADTSGQWRLLVATDTIPGEYVSILAEHIDGSTRSTIVNFIIKQPTFREKLIDFLTP